MKNINLVPITKETNIKGKTAFVKVELAGGLSNHKNILANVSYLFINNTKISQDVFIPDSVFIPEEVKPKPDRPFKQGDWVKPKDGVRGLDNFKNESHYTVASSEDEDGQVRILDDNNDLLYHHSYIFELVKPVEEIKEEERKKNPFYLEIDDDCVSVLKADAAGCVVFFNYDANYVLSEELAKELAQLTCDKLNEQYRKENNL